MKTASELLQQTRRMPLVAILRGLNVEHAKAVGLALYEAGFRTLEVPLNRPGAFACIEVLSKELPDDALVGGGTMLTQTDVDAVYAAGGRLMVSPNCNARVISHAAALGMLCAPGVATPTEAFTAFCDLHPDRTVVVYANTSAAVKARADWMVTSGCALDVVTHLKQQGKKILWAPDRHLGAYIQRETGADMVMWNGSCIVHDEFKAFELDALKAEHPGAKVLAHPESPAAVLACADAIGSTSGILKAAREMDATVFIVATDNGLMHKLRTLNPGKTFIEAPTAGNSATCKSCAHCPWMAMNSLQGLEAVLLSGANQIQVDPVLGLRARLPIDRMLDFTASRAKQAAGLVPNMGAA